MWLRESTAFAGLEVLLASYDLSRFYPSLDLYAMDCLALGQSVWFQWTEPGHRYQRNVPT